MHASKACSTRKAKSEKRRAKSEERAATSEPRDDVVLRDPSKATAVMTSTFLIARVGSQEIHEAACHRRLVERRAVPSGNSRAPEQQRAHGDPAGSAADHLGGLSRTARFAHGTRPQRPDHPGQRQAVRGGAAQGGHRSRSLRRADHLRELSRAEEDYLWHRHRARTVPAEGVPG